ncbi:3'-phosphoesterase [Streptomyces sp. PSKA54]|uniref:3'-phosphoesterase n=1 Tax=Streptomyces himalayensis subsp. aureolus TaxID=2758039 RepID=A0A7W2CZ02_9ACTN|nr:DNA polymerase ligase N-terminal domain-containing protein [Streptomyces himalayensis]MBA4861698.1 3'-phosphoesterase [Streptomyces himalayensis subsp. aureolus]
MGDNDALKTYRAKRHFGRTKEPRGDAARQQGGERARFVVQIHDARRMHFDFRLEADGVLKSWSVPKGPSNDPEDKRLAVPTEDHPLEYLDFEGVIPKGEYGGGTVIVWDRGTYRPLSHDRHGRPVPFDEALRRGHATFWLEGEKLHGGYALTRFRGGDGDADDEAWLLVKTDDERAHHGDHGTSEPRRARSALTGRTLRQVAESDETDESAVGHVPREADQPGTVRNRGVANPRRSRRT